jgi:uncharacterized SAM-binding protein YcdF (DUF218 family)
MSNVYWLFANLLHPFTVLMLALGVFVFWPQPATAPRRRGLKLFYVLTYLYCTPLVASLPITWLETRFPRTTHRPENLDAIVVLSGGVLIPIPADEPPYLVENSWRRCQLAARLYHQGPPCPVLASGGIVFLSDRPPPMSHVMRSTLEEMGVASEDILVEDRSRNTAENAEFSAEIIRQRGWKRVALVTSAMHLWRSERFFRRAGVDVIPIGCMYRSDEFGWSVFAFLPREGAALQHQEAMHELLGGLYAFLQGQW